ncbi:MAG: PAS domain S-box protein [Gammaproteobacteria bacterium]
MSDTKRLRILIVDDDPDDAGLIKLRLQKVGYTVHWAENEHGFNNEIKNTPDLIIADYRMPSFGAMRILEIVEQVSPGIPVIVVSGAVGEDRVSEVMKRGAADYLLKDRLARLEGAIEQALIQRDLRQDRIEAERALEDREARLAALFAGQPDCVMVVDRNGEIRDVNPAGVALFEAASSDELAGEPLTSYLHPSDRFSYWQLHRAALQGERGKVKFRLVAPSGTERWMEAHSAPLGEDDADIEPAVLSIVRDITANQRAEMRTREGESVLREIGTAMPFGFWFAELQPYRILFVTEALAQLLGRTREEIYADPAALGRPDPRKIGVRRFEVTRPDGVTVQLVERTQAIRDEAGDVYRIAGTVEKAG